MKAHYPGYLFLFLFNTTNYFIYIKDVFQVKDINKNSRGKQSILCNYWKIIFV